MRQRLAIILAALVCLAPIPGLASAATGGTARATVTTRVGLAGYHFRTRKTYLRIRGHITVPKSTCGAKTYRYAPQIGAGFTVGSLPEDAIVVLHLKCSAGRQRPGTAELVAGYHVKMPARLITAGQTVRIRITVTSGRASAQIIYPNGASVTVSSGGGKPTGVSYALVLPATSPPHYSPIAFTGCWVNRVKLSAYHPNIWRSVTKSGAVDGTVSRPLGGGSKFTISY